MKWLEKKIPPVFLVAITGLLMQMRTFWIDIADVPNSLRFGLAATCFGLAMALGVTAVNSFRLHKTTVNPHHADRASSLVTQGIFQWTRNPMYVSMVLLLLSWLFVIGNALSVLWIGLFVLYMTVFQIWPEERALMDKFGEPYRDYLGQVNRWI